jgi:glutamine cyclotransferase
MMGQTYEQRTGQLGKAQKMSNLCVSIDGAKSSQHLCNEIDLETRKQIFKDFWKMTWKEKKAFICNLVEKVPIKSRQHNSGEKENV